MKLTLNGSGQSRLASLALCLGLAAFSPLLGQPARGQANGAAPVILSQPLSETVEYGANATFSVAVTGAGSSSFQWLKNGRLLADYDNISGSQSSALTVVGAAGNDEGRYSVVVTDDNGGAVTSAVAVLHVNPMLLFKDDLENGAGNWKPLLDSSSLDYSLAGNHTSGGSWGLALTNSSQKDFHNLPVQYSCRVNYAFWFYDDGQGQAALGGELRGYSGAGYAKYVNPGGLLQIIGIGRYNTDFPSNNTGVFRGESFDPARYQGYILRGTNSGWFNLNAKRSIGWHQLKIDRGNSAAAGVDVDFYVDGVLARSVPAVNGAAVDSLFLGALEGDRAPGTNGIACAAFFDDVSVQTYPGLFDWQSLSTFGPVPDWMKLRETGTNWHLANLAPVTVSTLSGSGTNGGAGAWASVGGMIYSASLRGHLEYTVTTTADDAYRIEVEGRERNHRTPIVDLPIEVWVDGESLGEHNLSYGPQTNGFLHCFTPFLRAGTHSIRLHWANVDGYRSVLIQNVRLQTLTSPLDTRGNLRPWVANRLAAQDGVEICPAASLVSPVCLEGRGQFLSMMNLVADYSGQFVPVAVQHGAGHRWYANVPLSVSNATTILSAYQNGAFIQTNEVTWQAINLLAETNSLTLRKGDSLLLTAHPAGATNGEVELTDGTTSITTDASAPVPWQFNQAGTFTITASYAPTGQQGSLQVTVVEATFDSSPLAAVYHSRFWSCTNLPTGVVLDVDPRLKVTSMSGQQRAAQQQLLELPPVVANERDYLVYTRSTEPQYILARLGTNGPVLANVAVRGFRWNIAPDTYLRALRTNPDGSQLIETAFVAGPTYPSLSVYVQIISTGVVFEDGTVTKTLTAQDFDETGTARVRFIRPASARGSTCHTTHIYDNGVLIGWR